MHTLNDLRKLSSDELKRLAAQFGIEEHQDMEALIQAILAKQDSPQSEFLSDDDDASEFYTSEEVSTFMNETDASTFQDYEASIFLGEDDNQEKKVAHPLMLNNGDKILLNKKEYEILGLISKSSGEAVIYKASEVSSGQVRVLKIYRNLSKKQEPNAKALKKILLIEDEDVLCLYDFGTGDKKFAEKHCFEVSDFAKGGDLLSVKDFKAKYTTTFLRSNVIPEIFNGIKRLHRAGIIHCDLKPQNVFYLDENQTDLVIGDYGSAKTKDHTEEMDMVSQVIGTRYYMPSEQGQLIVSEKNDYYSFGMVLLHLLYPQHLCYDDDPKKVEKKKFNQIVLRKYDPNVGISFFIQNTAHFQPSKS